MKKYKLLIDSPELHNGAVAELQEKEEVYKVVFSRGAHYLSPEQVENRPTVWQEIVEEPEKKIVERWRGKVGNLYFNFFHKDLTEVRDTVDNLHYNAGYYFKNSAIATRAKNRTEIMCRLMGLAETIEEGSTECKGKWTIGHYVSNTVEKLLPVSCATYIMHICKIATFSTKELAQLFLDSAGQDAIDWYGEVK